MSFLLYINMGSICRPVLLFNNYLPADNRINNWDYCAYGIVDGISVGENIYDEKKVCVTESILEYKRKYDKRQSNQKRYSVQMLFAISEMDEIQEKEFWNNDENYPFLLLCRMQFMKGNKSDILSKKEKITEALNFSDEFCLISYVTYDNSDLLIVIKSKTYEAGAGAINKIREFKNDGKDFLKNSFTIWAVKHTFIDGMSDEIRYKLNRIKIEEVNISIIAKTGDGIDKIVQELKKRKSSFSGKEDIMIDCRHVLGISDEIITIKNIGWGDFLLLYHREKGMFCDCNKIFELYISGSTTEIRTTINKYDCEFVEIIKDLTDKRNDEEVRKYLEQIEKMEQLLNCIEDKYVDAGYDELRIIINVLSKYADSIFNDYIFFDILPSLDALLNNINSHICVQNKNMFVPKYYFFEYLKGLIMYIQNSNKLDRHSMQVLDFNVKLYDIPVKITAFYNAYIYRVRQVLNSTLSGERDICYEFLTVPAIGDIVQVMEIYPNVVQKYRIMKVEVPEESYYNFKCLMVILAHEMAHYVGREYRNRKCRYMAIIKSYSHVYLEYVKRMLGELTDWSVSIDEKKWNVIQGKLEFMIQNGVAQYENVTFLSKKYPELSDDIRKEILKEASDEQKHFRLLKLHIESTMVDIWQYAIEDVFIPILFGEEEIEKQNRIKVIKNVTERFIISSMEKNTLLNSTNVMQLLEQLYEECFADLMSILILDIDVSDYLECFLENAKQQNIALETLLRSDVIARVALIIYCNSDRMSFSNNDVLYQIEQDNNKKSLFNCAYKYLERHIIGQDETIGEQYKKRYDKEVINMLEDKVVFDEMVLYLKECQDSFDVMLKKGNIKEDLIKIRNAFGLLSSLKDKEGKSVSLEKQIINMIEFIEEYKISFFNDRNNGENIENQNN